MGEPKRHGRRRRFAPLTAALLLSIDCHVAWAQPDVGAPADGPELASFDADELYLLDVRAAGETLGQSLPAFEREGSYFIEIGALTASVEFPIVRRGDVWSGWFFSEDRLFGWDMTAGLVRIASRDPEPVDPAGWFEAAGEVFVAESLLEQWFGIGIDVDARQQRLTVSTDEPLPFERWRERTLAKHRYRRSDRIDPDVVVPDQYRWATQPLVNVDSRTTTRSNAGSRSTSSTTTIAAGMDLLKHSVAFSGSYTQSTGPDSAPTDATRRLTIERFAASPQSPIFADVHHYAVGDVFESRPSLVSVPIVGRGFAVERYADTRTGNLSTVTIADNAPPGWEVELYRNGMLVDFATVGSDGRYVFDGQDIYFGENEFVARLYGPQGQVRQDRRTYFGGGIDLDPGDYDYSVSHIDFSEFLLDGRPRDYRAMPASYTTDLRYSRALSADVEIGGAFTRSGLGSRDRDGTFVDQDYLSVFGRARLGPGVLVGEAVEQLDAGHALSLEYLTGLAGTTLSFAHRTYDDFESPATLQAEPLDSFTELSALGAFGQGDRNGYRAGVRRRALLGGGADFRLFGRIGMRAGPLSLTNELEYRADGGENAMLGIVRVAGRIGGISVRGQIDYSPSRSAPIRQISASMNWDVAARVSNNLTISRSFDPAGGIFASSIVSVRVRNFDLTFGATSDFDRDWSVSAGVSFAFGYDKRRGSFMTDYQSLAQTGRATMNVFVDRNNNGIRDAGELPVAGAAYRGKAATESAPGAVTLTAIPGEAAVRVDTSRLELDDPFLVPLLDAYEIRTHAGSDIEIDIPVVMTGDVEGSVFDASGRPARGVEIVLLDADGNERRATRAEFDGYYGFTGVPGGEYRIAIRTADGDPVALGAVTLDAERGYVVAEDIYLAPGAVTETSQ